MGCGQSKIENEEAVTRCKDRKQSMKEAVSFRNAFAAAHSAYAMSLKNTGAALSDFAHGEVINPNYHPTTTTTTTSSSSSSSTHQSLPATSAAVTAQPPPPPDILPPPPPPIAASFPPSPLHRAVSMPEMKIPIKPENSAPVAVGPTIMEEEDDDIEMEIEKREKLVTRKRGSRREVANDPPPPPTVAPVASAAAMQTAHDSRWAEYSDYIFQPQESMMGPGLTPVVEEDKVFEERPKRVEAVEEVRKSAKVVVVEPPEKVAVVDTPVVVVVGGGGSGGSVGKSVKKGKGGGERRVAKGSVNLLQIFMEVDDHFLKASESAHEVSKMLEATRLHYHSNFADNRGNDLRLSDECCYIREFRFINWNNDIDSVCVNL